MVHQPTVGRSFLCPAPPLTTAPRFCITAHSQHPTGYSIAPPTCPLIRPSVLLTAAKRSLCTVLTISKRSTACSVAPARSVPLQSARRTRAVGAGCPVAVAAAIAVARRRCRRCIAALRAVSPSRCLCRLSVKRRGMREGEAGRQQLMLQHGARQGSIVQAESKCTTWRASPDSVQATCSGRPHGCVL